MPKGTCNLSKKEKKKNSSGLNERWALSIKAGAISVLLQATTTSFLFFFNSYGLVCSSKSNFLCSGWSRHKTRLW